MVTKFRYCSQANSIHHHVTLQVACSAGTVIAQLQETFITSGGKSFNSTHNHNLTKATLTGSIQRSILFQPIYISCSQPTLISTHLNPCPLRSHHHLMCPPQQALPKTESLNHPNLPPRQNNLKDIHHPTKAYTGYPPHYQPPFWMHAPDPIYVILMRQVTSLTQHT